MGERREARELALQCLYQWDQQGPDDGRELATQYLESRAASPDSRKYAAKLLEHYWDHALAIDERIAICADNWSVHRMSVIDRNILRLAVTELNHMAAVPSRVILDEAIELAKRFSTEKSGSFVNGILDRVLKEQEESHGA